MREGVKSFLFVLFAVLALFMGFDYFVTDGRLTQTLLTQTPAGDVWASIKRTIL